MRILLNHRFFWPDSPPYASMLRSIGKHFAAMGHAVTILSAQPSYRAGVSVPKQASREELDGIQIRRIALLKERRKDLLIRGLNGALYSTHVFLHILFSRRYDLVMASTFPPILLAFLACLASKIRGCRFVYHCQDIHPELSFVTRQTEPSRWMSFLRRLDNWTCRNADTVVVLSEDMRRTLADRPAGATPRIRIINNFELPHFETVEDTESAVGLSAFHDSPGVGAEPFRVVFAGNLGRFQSLDTVVRAAAMLRDLPALRIILMGDGVMQEELQRLAAEMSCDNVNFIPFQKPAVAKRLIEQADFGLVTLRADMHRVAYPSKTMTYLGSGIPVIVMVDSESELARSVVAERLGLVVGDVMPQALASAVRAAYRDREAWRTEHTRLRDYASHHGSEKAAFRLWGQLLATD